MVQLFSKCGHWPTNDQDWCEYFKLLDKEFNTPSDSIPLGHDFRCRIHGLKYNRNH